MPLGLTDADGEEKRDHHADAVGMTNTAGVRKGWDKNERADTSLLATATATPDWRKTTSSLWNSVCLGEALL